jgi:uncharacterized protein YqjF (DUF2071 family)
MTPQGPPLSGRRIMSQWWRDICFVHWSVDPALMAPHLPPGVRPDLHEGSAWVGLIPFRMVDAGLGRGPAVPFLGSFLEMNVRTYSVDDSGRRGVVFLSLEAQRALVVAGAVGVFAVPYKWARMRFAAQPDNHGRLTVNYTSRRLVARRPQPSSRMSVCVGPAIATPSARDHFLTARFGLHTRAAGRTLWVPNTHGPWPLHSATLLDLEDSLLSAAGLPGLTPQRAPDSVLFSPGVRTEFGFPERVR